MIQTKKTRTIRPPSLLPERALSHPPVNGCQEVLNILDKLSSKGSKKQKKNRELWPESGTHEECRSKR
jgi:hypothetical protein